MILPKQKTTLTEKFQKDANGRCNIYDTIDYYINQVAYGNHVEEMLLLRDMVHGVIYERDYKNITNPYNMKTGLDGTAPSFNARLKNHNILKGIVNLLLGEFGRRAHDYEVTTFNPYEESVYKDKLTLALKGYYQQQVINELNAMGFPTDKPSQELPTLEEYTESFRVSYDEARVFTGQDALDYIRFDQDLDDKYLDAYWNWIVYGRFYTYKSVLNDKVIFEQVSPFEMFVPNEPGNKYVEDRSFAIRKRRIPVANLIDMFRDDLTNDMLNYLDSEYSSYSGVEDFGAVDINTGRNGLIKLPSMWVTNDQQNTFRDMTHGIELYHVQFKTWDRVGFLTFKDPLGQIRTIEVDSTYTLDKENGDIDLEWKWQNIVMQAWKFKDYYIRVEPLLENRAELGNTSKQKLSYNGIEERSPDGGVQSIIKEGVDYQRSINLLHFQVEKIINKNKDKLVVMPFGMIPKKQGMTTKDVMYHADATSILWVDETAPNAQYASQLIKTLDLSLGNYIKDVLEIIEYTKREYWNSIGMNDQRYADINQNAGKGTTEQAIVRSATITAELTRQFEKVQEKDYQGLIDISKLAWINGVQSKYIRSDKSAAFLKLNADDAIHHSESSYGVFVVNSNNNTEARDALRALAQPFVQNGSPSVAAALYSTNNVSKLKNIVEKVEANNKKHEQLMEQIKAENAQALQQMVDENDQANRDIKKYESDNQLAGVMYTADKRMEGNKRTEPQPAREPNQVEIATANSKITNDAIKTQQKNVELSQKDREINLKAKQVNNSNNSKK